ncbi:MAG: LamG domain-containing protein [Chitinophagaceae bacterium]
MRKPAFIFIPLLFSCQLAISQTALTYNAAVPSYVQMGTTMNNVLAGTNTITAEAWCYLTAYPFLPTVIGNYGAGMQFLLRIDNNRAAFWVDQGTGFRVINGSTIIPLNTWTHIAGVWNGSDLKVYVNGVLDGTTTGVSGAFPTSANPVRIGANQLSEAWTGKIDAVRVWSTARTVIQINNVMNSCLTGSETGLLALYNFEEASGTFVGDITGHGYNGTLMNSPAWTGGYNTGCSTLPVNFLSIGANRTSNGVLVNWKVAGEQEMLQYEIERSTEGRSFSKVGTVSANNSTDYQWLDMSAMQQEYYYRVKSIDQPGIIKYTGIVKVSGGNSNAKITVLSNPVEGSELNLQFRNQHAGHYIIRLLDLSGRVLIERSAEHTGGNITLSIELPATISRGLYQLLVIAPGKTVTVQKLFISGLK